LAKPVCERAGNIGFGGEAFIVEFIAVSVGVQEFSNEHLRPGVLAFDLAHVIAAGFFGVDICHSVKVGIALSFVLIQKKQKIKENPPAGGQAPIAPRAFPCQRSAKAFN
jgi:hypothetical protein